MKTIHHILIGVFSLVLSSSTYAGSLTNQLKNNPSPYLAVHANDPVHWQQWGKAVVTRAKKENKLIFISIGYFSCHWCHVMQRESFSDKVVAGLLNELTIPVKIDRELQPALDAWLIDFVEAATGQAGWPLNVFLTPEGYPLFGMTYLPKQNFMELLKNIQQRWHEDEAYLKNFAQEAFELKPATRVHTPYTENKKTAKRLSTLLIAHALQLGDDMSGGFGEQNKFPMSPQLLALLEIYQQYPNEQLLDFLILTLDNMARLGLHDHIGGGFYRYTIDQNWQTPHFEKMLYDNAQLALVYLRAAEIFNKKRYKKIANSTLDFILSQMKHTDNGYIASLSAVDDKDIEGGYYLWSIEELTALLTKKELAVAKLVWGLQDNPLLDAGHHLKIEMPIAMAAKKLSRTVSEIEQTLDNSVEKIKLARAKRNIPIDNKVLSGWNGLLLTSLSEAAGKTNNKTYYSAAEKLYQHLSIKMWDGKQLYRFIDNNKKSGEVSLEDYAYVADGILSWAILTGDKDAWSISLKIAQTGLELFNNKNGWQLSQHLFIPYDARELILSDSTMASPSATLLKALLKIAHQNQDDKLNKSLLELMAVDFEELDNSPLWYASHIALISSLSNTNKKQ